MNRLSLLRSFRKAEVDPNLQKIFQARRAIVVTGAGISAPSGLRTYNGPGARTPHPNEPSLIEDLSYRPAEVFEFNKQAALEAQTVEPNGGHRTLTICQERLAAGGGQMHLFTLNTDDLHERANTTGVVHIHGQLSWEVCTKCNTRTPAIHQMSTCDCGGMRRPDVSLDGERPRTDAELAFKRAIRKAEALVCVGTSGESQLLRQWVRVAQEHYKIPTLLLTKQPSVIWSSQFNIVIDDDAEEIRHYLPR